MQMMADRYGRSWPRITDSATNGENFSLFSMNMGENRAPADVVAMSLMRSITTRWPFSFLK